MMANATKIPERKTASSDRIGKFEFNALTDQNAKVRINQQISASKVRLIDENGKQCGIKLINDALEIVAVLIPT